MRCEPILIENVVNHLEEQSDLGAEATPVRPIPLGDASNAEAESDRGGEEFPRLEPVELRQILVVARDVTVLASDHPERRFDELAGDAGVFVRERETQGLDEQRIAGE